MTKSVPRLQEDLIVKIVRKPYISEFRPDRSTDTDAAANITASGDFDPCVVWGVGGEPLERVHSAVRHDAEVVLAEHQMTMHPQHEPWIPHITAAYVPPDDEVDLSAFADRVGPVSFDRVRLAFGDDVYDVPLGKRAALMTDVDDGDLVARFDPSQPRDPEGKWIDVPGTGGVNLPTPSDTKSLWKNLGDYEGQVIAERSTPRGLYSRLFVSRGPKGPLVREQERLGDEWSPYPPESDMDIKSAKKLSDHMNMMSGYKFVKPYKYDGLDVGGKPVGAPVSAPESATPKVKPTPVRYNPADYKNDYGIPESKWADLPLSEAPSDWNSGPNIITPDEAQKLHDDAMTKKPWTGDVAEVFSEYTGSSEPLHDALRAGSKYTENGDLVSESTKILDSGMYALPHDVTVFRSTTPDAFGAASVDDLLTKLKPGDVFADKGYLSTSVSQAQHLEGPISPVQIRVNVPKGTKAAYVGDVSQFPEQSELVIKRRTKLQVDRVEEKDGRVFVYMDVVK